MKSFVFFLLWSVFSASVIFGAAERNSVFLLHDRILVLKDRVEAKSDEAPEQLGTAYVGYFEILNSRWPNEHAEAMLVERRPLSASHSSPALTFTHGESGE